MQCTGQKLEGLCVPVPKSSREKEQILVTAIHLFACLFQPELRERGLRKNKDYQDLSRKATGK